MGALAGREDALPHRRRDGPGGKPGGVLPHPRPDRRFPDAFRRDVEFLGAGRHLGTSPIGGQRREVGQGHRVGGDSCYLLLEGPPHPLWAARVLHLGLGMRPIAVVLGTRPELIKLAPVIHALSVQHPITVVKTGQHTDLLGDAQFPASVTVCDVAVDHDPDPLVYAEGLRVALRAVWIDQRARPWAVVVQGDTTSAYAGAMAAFGLDIPVAHVEAGVRSGDLAHPWPEEEFRVAIDRVARWCFAVSDVHARAIEAEGRGSRADREVVVVGNTVADALFGAADPVWGANTALCPQRRVLVTLHRREGSFAGVVAGLVEACRAHPDTEFLWVTHPNGRAVRELAGLPHPANLVCLPPVARHGFVALLRHSQAVVTDSGGVQEEAALLGVPCVVARQTTDRPETVVSGHAVVAGFDPQGVVDGVAWALARGPQPRFGGYGDGKAAERIAAALVKA